MYQKVTSNDIAVIVTRSCSSVKSASINFDADHGNANPSDVIHRSSNTFQHPMAGANNTGGNHDTELQWQLQIGSKMFPEYPVISLAETFYQLKKALGIHGSAFHSVAITPQE